MNSKSIRILCLSIPIALCSCGLFKKEKEADTKPEPSTRPALVGRIASIPADKRFVLIQSYGVWNVPVDSILTTRGPNERAANLLVTGEKLGQFAAADLKSGTLDIGDGVYYLPPPPPAAPEPAPEPIENQNEASEIGKVLKNN